jgi:hypothetical protein
LDNADQENERSEQSPDSVGTDLPHIQNNKCDKEQGQNVGKTAIKENGNRYIYASAKTFLKILKTDFFKGQSPKICADLEKIT